MLTASLLATQAATATCAECASYDFEVHGVLTDQRDQTEPSIVLSLVAKAGRIGMFAPTMQAVHIATPEGAVATSVQADNGTCTNTGDVVCEVNRRLHLDDVHIEIVYDIRTDEPLGFRVTTARAPFDGNLAALATLDLDISDNEVTLTAPLYAREGSESNGTLPEPFTPTVPAAVTASRIVLRCPASSY